MIVDLILNRKDNEKYRGKDTYNAHDFYYSCMRYGRIADPITAAMDGGTEEQVKNSLCAYIDDQDYNPEIKKYINSKNWLE